MSIEIKKDIFYVGAKDWNVRNFHGYLTSRGTTYNAFLILDEKIVLVDTVKESRNHEMLERIKEIIDPSKIDIIISNHVEMDHSGGLPFILQFCPNAEIWTSPKGEQGLKEHYDTSKWKIRAVKSGENISIGKRSLSFVHTPMVHWPDSMVTYIPEEKLLLPNDAFGQHLATEGFFDDQSNMGIVMEEAAKYYANIVYPYGGPTLKALHALEALEIDLIVPSHGVMWRKHIPEILAKYKKWASNDLEEKAVIVYDSMWGSTESMAEVLQFEIEKMHMPVIVRNLKYVHISDVINDMLEAKYIFIGTPTLNNMVLPTMASMLTYIEGLRPLKKVGFAFGSFGWNGTILSQVEEVMKKLSWEIPVPAESVKYRPNDSNLEYLREVVHKIIKK